MGRAHAQLLASRGAAVVVNDLASGEDPAARVVAEILRGGGQAVKSNADISSEEGATSLVDIALETFGRIDILVNNAGVIVVRRLEELDTATFDRTMRINAYGPFFMVRAAWRHFVAQRYGRVVMVSSSAALFGLPDRVDYAASKAAMVGMTRSFAADGDEHGIRANALFPTAITRISSVPVRERVAGLLGLSSEDGELPALMERSTALVSPMVAWLAHEGCDANGEIFEAGTGHAGRVLITSTRGYDNMDITPEDIHAHLNEIRSLDGLTERKNFSTRAAGVTASAPDPQL